MYRLFPLAIDEVGTDKTPAIVALNVAFTVIDAKRVQRIVRIGVLGIEEKRAVGTQRIEDTVLVETGVVELIKIVLRA